MSISDPYTILLTKRKSPTSSVSSMEPVGIRNAWMTRPRMTTVRTIARRSASTYSRKVDLMRALARAVAPVAALAMLGVPLFIVGSPLHPKDREERLLGDPDGADLLHSLFSLALLLEELPFPGVVPAVALP